MSTKKAGWTIWVLMTILLSIYFSYNMFLDSGNADIFLPGKTSHAHHQIEMACAVCHTETNTIKEDVCIDCHSADLEKFNDSHPKRKFMDPRNADRLEKLDASNCLTCHQEHVDNHTNEMAVTVPVDYCIKCHDDISTERPSHEGLGFETCATAGCHNYHDNTALYEDFLIKHSQEEAILSKHTIPSRLKKMGLMNEKVEPLPTPDFAEKGGINKPGVIELWSKSQHAVEGVNCSDCHNQNETWVDKPNIESCKECHEKETEGFLSSFHGMRLSVGMTAMKPSMAEIPMHENAAHKKLGCVSCHTSHEFDKEEASYKACIQCHDDQHTNMYVNSKHFQLWIDKGFDGGVSCATCHLPRIETSDGDKKYHVQHNQNENLRPNEKMIRSVCMNCHGLGFSIDALADRELILRNFIGLPRRHIKSIDMAKERHEH